MLWFAVLLLRAPSNCGAQGQPQPQPTAPVPALSASAHATPFPVAPTTLSLKEAVLLGLKQNPNSTIARLRAEQSRSRSRSALSELLPQVALTSDIFVWRFNEQSFFGNEHPVRVGPFQVIDAGPTATQSVVDLPKLRRFQASREEVRGSLLDERNVREAVVDAIVLQYLEILRADAAREAAVSQVELAQRLYDQAVDQQHIGVGTGIDTLRSQVELLNERQRLIEARSAVDTAKFALEETLDLPRTTSVETSDHLASALEPLDSTDGLIQRAIDQRPDLLALKSSETAAHLATKAASEERLPKIDFRGSWDYQGRVYSNGIPAYRYEADLSLPLFTSGRIGAAIAHARLEEKRESEQERALRAGITREVKTAADEYESARAALEVAVQALGLAQREVEQAGRRFKAGVSTNVEVIQAQDAYARASDNQIQAIFRLNVEKAALAKATGSIEDTYSH